MKKLLTAAEILAADDRPRERPGESLLTDFIGTVEAGQVPNDEALRKVAEGLRRVLEGTPASKAFGLSRRPGRPQHFLTGRELDRRSEAAARMKLRIKMRHESKTRAAEWLSIELGMGKTAILDAFANYSNDTAAQTMFDILQRRARYEKSLS